MCTEEFIRMMFTVDLYGNRGLDSRSDAHDVIIMSCAGSERLISIIYVRENKSDVELDKCSESQHGLHE